MPASTSSPDTVKWSWRNPSSPLPEVAPASDHRVERCGRRPARGRSSNRSWKMIPYRMVDYGRAVSGHTLETPAAFNFGADVVDAWARDPSRTALVWCDAEGRERRLTYAEVARASNRVANRLAARGIRKGDRVIVMLPRIPEWQISLTACLKLGAVPIPCITMLTERDVVYRVRHSGASPRSPRARRARSSRPCPRSRPGSRSVSAGPGGTPGAASRRRATNSPPPSSKRRIRPSCTTRRVPPASRRGSCMPRAPCTHGGFRRGTGSPSARQRRHVVHCRHRLVEGGNEHLLRPLEPGLRGAVPRRPLRCAASLRAHRTLPGHRVLRRRHRASPARPRGRVGAGPLGAEARGVRGRVRQPRDPRRVEAQDRRRAARRLRTDRDVDDGAELPRHAGEARLDGTPLAGGRGGGARRGRAAPYPRRARSARHPGAEPAAHARLLERSGAHRGAVRRRRRRAVVRHRRHRGHGRGRLSVLLRPRRRRHRLVRLPHRAPGGGERAHRAPRGAASRRWSDCRIRIEGRSSTAFVILRRRGFEAGSARSRPICSEHVRRITAPYKYPRRIEFVDSLPKTVSGKIQRNVLRQTYS